MIRGTTGLSRKSLYLEVRETIKLQLLGSPLLEKEINTVTIMDQGLPILILFFDNELLRVQTPHFDPLVISVWICNSQVKQVLVDGGSSVDVLFFNDFQSRPRSNNWV